MYDKNGDCVKYTPTVQLNTNTESRYSTLVCRAKLSSAHVVKIIQFVVLTQKGLRPISDQCTPMFLCI